MKSCIKTIDRNQGALTHLTTLPAFHFLLRLISCGVTPLNHNSLRKVLESYLTNKNLTNKNFRISPHRTNNITFKNSTLQSFRIGVGHSACGAGAFSAVLIQQSTVRVCFMFFQVALLYFAFHFATNLRTNRTVLESNNVLPPVQGGFRLGRSTAVVIFSQFLYSGPLVPPLGSRSIVGTPRS